MVFSIFVVPSDPGSVFAPKVITMLFTGCPAADCAPLLSSFTPLSNVATIALTVLWRVGGVGILT